MKVVALVSGGKDSCFAMLESVRYGHDIVCLAHLHPPLELPVDKSEIDSFMFQSVGYNVVQLIAKSMELPFLTETITGKAIKQDIDYAEMTQGDEVEDLYRLLVQTKQQFPDVQGVCTGAIFSSYQRNRIEHICARLGLISLGYLWRKDQKELLQEMIDHGMEAILVKIASMGLKPHVHLGRSIADLYGQFMELNKKYQFHVCGEGGEYETITLNCPLFKKRIVLDATHTVLHTDDFCAPVAFLVVDACHLEDKTPEELEKDAALIERLKQDHLNQCKLSPTPSETIPFILEKKDPKLLKSGTTMIYGFQGQYYLSGITAYTPIDGVVSLHPLAGKENQKELSIAEEVDACFERVKILLLTQKMTLEDVCFVHLYVHDMKEFGLINTEYCRHFGSRNPPSRSCIEIKRLKLAKTRILMDCFAIQGSGVAKMDKENIHRDVLHIQSISSWAPTCIGPYSQANILRQSVILLAGQIALYPPTMEIHGATRNDQAQLCFRNVCRVLEALESNLHHIYSIVVYLQQDTKVEQDFETFSSQCLDLLLSNAGLVDAFSEVKEVHSCSSEDEEEIYSGDNHEEKLALVRNIPILYIEVSHLPQSALVELEAQALTHKVLQSLTVSSEATSITVANKKYEFQSAWVPRALCHVIGWASGTASCVSICEELHEVCSNLIQGLKSSFKEANFPFHHLLHLRIFYRCDLIDQNLLLETFEQVLVGSSTCAMTFVDAIKIQDHALLAIQATAQDLDKLETELWLRRLI